MITINDKKYENVKNILYEFSLFPTLNETVCIITFNLQENTNSLYYNEFLQLKNSVIKFFISDSFNETFYYVKWVFHSEENNQIIFLLERN